MCGRYKVHYKGIWTMELCVVAKRTKVQMDK